MRNSDANTAEPTMKWFRRHEYDAAAYGVHLALLSPHLPPTLRLPSEGGGLINLHDGWLIDSREADGSVTLDIAAYDYAQSGWNDARVDLHVRILYQDAIVHGPTLDELWLWRRSGVEILASELDRTDGGRYIHRFLV